ncbi:hypothetical protein CYMTET_30174 [Cymbomonas tetramitiformis]|uniref:Uncharacterized protein n=1 Tax=Cymbomonas tetramitiformis TaxID=36881 RepID=A0AAE0FJD1_9CHLO|nr:hypothetical protein CYMTET_30174 [Cymbomonas tetramitiformis]
MQMLIAYQRANSVSYVTILKEIVMRLSASPARVDPVVLPRDDGRATLKSLQERALLMALRTSAGIEEELRPRSPLLSEHVGSIFVKVPAVRLGACVPQQARSLIFRGSPWTPVTRNEDGKKIAHVVESTVINLVSGEEAFIGDDLLLDSEKQTCSPVGRRTVTSAEIVEGAVMLCYNEKTFLEDQEFRQNLSKFLVASSNIQRFKNTVSIETSLSVILRTSVYMASRMKSVMVGARNKKGMQHIQLKNISTLFWDYLACKMGEVQKGKSRTFFHGLLTKLGNSFAFLLKQLPCSTY